jgi:murein DD-endopeptidase MepM/ murein hydrolase activator NlpD
VPGRGTVAPSIRRGAAVTVVFLLCMLLESPSRAATAPPVGSWSWPIEGQVVRGFEPPPTPFSAGHRGIDIAAAFGTPVHAAADGVVSFAGLVAGELFVTIDHGDGYRSTDSWLGQILVKKGQSVKRGDVLALSGRGDPKVAVENLMFSVRIGDTYIDPLTALVPQSAVDLIRLAPITGSGSTALAGEAGLTAPRAFWWVSGLPPSNTQPVRIRDLTFTTTTLQGPRWVS